MNVNMRRRFQSFIKRHYPKAPIWKVLSYLMRIKMGNNLYMITINYLDTENEIDISAVEIQNRERLIM